jgi:hypothetical protein
LTGVLLEETESELDETGMLLEERLLLLLETVIPLLEERPLLLLETVGPLLEE